MERDVIDLCSSPEILDLADSSDVNAAFQLTDDELELPEPVFPAKPETPAICERQEVLQPESVSEEDTQKDIDPFSSPLIIGQIGNLRATLTPESSPTKPLATIPPTTPQPDRPAKRPRFAKSTATASTVPGTKRATRSKSVKKRTDRVETAQDMIVEFAGQAPFVQEASDALLKIPVRKIDHVPSVEDGVVFVWLSREVADRFDEDQDMFVPCEPHTEHESTCLCVITSESFLDVLLDETQHATYFGRLSQLAKTPDVIYIVQGLQSVVRKHKNRYNRIVQRRARAYMEGCQQADLSPVARDPVDPESVFAGQTRLQVRCSLNVLYTAGSSQTVDWILDLVQDFSLARYRTRYLDYPTVKSGLSPDQCTMEALIRLARVTPSIAARIQSVFPNLASLLHALCTHGPSCMVGHGVVGAAMADSIYQALCGSSPQDQVLM